MCKFLGQKQDGMSTGWGDSKSYYLGDVIDVAYALKDCLL